MHLIHLHLQNFRQHADTEIHFPPGLTGIVGPNGAGKSTILEAIAWAIYGSEAARGTNDTIRFARAGSRARVEVELGFGLSGHEYRIVRSLNNAEVFLDGGSEPVATTVGGATRYLQGRLGMSRREFFNTYFTGQKELQFLAAMGPADRGRFLSQVLGYERLRQAQQLARERRNELRHEIAGIRAAMGDLDEIRAARTAAEAKVTEAHAALDEAETQRAASTARLGELAPRWAEVQAARDRYRDLSHTIETAQRERETARRDIARADSELEAVVRAERELVELREQLLPLPGVAEECERLSELARLDERRKAIAKRLSDTESDLGRVDERIAKVSQAPELAERYAAELNDLRTERQQLEAELEERKTVWLRDRQDAETKLQTFRDRGKELKEQIRGIRDAGPAGKCPTCERPLGADFERVLGELEEQWSSVVQDGKWWHSRYNQLKGKPEEVTTGETRLAAVASAVDEKARKHTRCEAAVQELQTLRDERAQRMERREELRREIESIPSGYDSEAHGAAEAKLRMLRALETRVARLEEAAGRRAGLEKNRGEAAAQEAAAAARGVAAAAERERLGFSEEVFTTVRTESEQASEALRRAELRAAELRGQLKLAEQAREAAGRDEAEYRERAREIEVREDDFRHHNELDAALSELRAELNAQVRPELSEIASLFLTQLTDGRYTALEIDDGYNILILDEGEEKPVISGGEEDVANLVLRLSLSQMIAERAGYPFSLLILDEVFGSLDVARRDNVVQLLRRLEDRFEQVILITHIEGIRENLDQVFRVEFDERSGASAVREESFAGTAGALEEMAAD